MDFCWLLLLAGVRHSRYLLLSSLIGTLGSIEYSVALMSDIPFSLLSYTDTYDYHSTCQHASYRQRNSDNLGTSGSATLNVPVSTRAARIGLIFGGGGTKLVRFISEEKTDGASSIMSHSMEYLVLQFSSLPQGSTRTAGTLEAFFDFLTLVRDVRKGWSPWARGHYCRKNLVFLANRVHEEASRSLIPPLFREMLIIVFLATIDSIQVFDANYLIPKLCSWLLHEHCSSISIQKHFFLTSSSSYG